MVTCNNDAKRYLGTLFGVAVFLFLLFQISLFGSFHVFVWPILFPLIYTALLVFLEQKRGRKIFTGIRLVMWLIWALFSFAMVIVYFVAVGDTAKYCTAHPCVAGIEAVILEVVVFIFLIPAIIILVCACTMFGMTVKEFRSAPGQYESADDGGIPDMGTDTSSSSAQSRYNTL